MVDSGNLSSEQAEKIGQVRHEANKDVIVKLSARLGTFVTGFLGRDMVPEIETNDTGE